jgi:DNA-binding beta-propeller fold protein YncE
MFVFLTSLSASLIALSGPTPPFQGQELEQLQATGNFLLPALAAVASAAGLYYLLRDWSPGHVTRVITLTFFAILSILTARASFRAAYINYDNATEYLVYAHAATGVKEVIAQAEEISRRTAGGLNVALAYDASQPDTGVSWPVVWYLRDFTNQRSFDVPTRSLRDAVIIIVDQKNFDKIEAAIGDGYYRFDYIRMWWPNQDYFTLSNPRDPAMPFDENYSCRGLLGFYRWNKSRDYSPICNTLTDPNMRAGIIDIWLNRDFTRYGQALAARNPAENTARFTLAQWDPADQMRLYIRKDVASQIWNYGVGPSVSSQAEDPTLGKIVDLSADAILDATQVHPVSLNAPRGLAFAPDGTLYVADSRNNRILHLDPTGTILHEWGTFGDANVPSAPAPIGTFNEPWGVAVGPDGSVYVTDTWNHRVQKFTATGTPLTMWGQYGLPGTIEGFWGPRGIAVDRNGRVYVADTGNKRIMVFDKNGGYLTEFGSAGLDPGQFDEPVGLAIGNDGIVYVTDTWNQRVQSFIPSEDGLTYTPYRQWDIYGWFGQSVENKPFIAVNAENHVFITDPESYRVMEFTDGGELVRVWGDYGNTLNTFGLTSGIAVDADGHIWVTDPVFNRIMRFTLPGAELISPPIEPSPTEALPLEPSPTGPTPTEAVPPEPTPTVTSP